jgi:hypothetical protein
MDGEARAKVNRRLLRALGLAGLAGVAATGAVIARSERQRRAVTPDEVRERLHARLAGARSIDRSDPRTATGLATGDQQ